MRTIKGFRMRKLGLEYIITAEGVELINFNKMIALNESAAYLWESVQEMEEFSVDTLADLLVEQYGIDRELALKDSAAVAQKWIEAGIAEE
ncbi:MAG: PqqD family protein [Bacteroidales bacterium]|nr:PqqD family protein [Bacteroidales bacterium]